MQNASQALIQANTVDFMLKRFGIGLFQERSVHEFLWGYNDTEFSKVASGLTRSKIPSFYALQVMFVTILRPFIR